MLRTLLLSLTGLFLFGSPLNINFNPINDVAPKGINSTQIAPRNYQINTIVIDAGHGGRDRGCSGRHTREKDITLAVAKKLGYKIRSNYPSLRVIYTRETDKFIPLHERAAIANNNKANLFISLHCNAMRNASYVRGSETYVMGLHTAAENLAVAKRENEAILLEVDYKKNYDGFDPNSPEGHIILSMYQNAFLEQSILLAEKIEHQLKEKAIGRSLGVKQAGFLVLRQTAMPSVLVEMGYLTNTKDEAYLQTPLGQAEIASSIFNAFQSYKIEMETNNPQAALSSQNISSGPYARRPAKVKPANTSNPGKEAEMEYRVQLAASLKPMNISHRRWQYTGYVLEEDYQKPHYRYFATGFSNRAEAEAAKAVLRKKGFKDAFLVGFINNQRILISQ